MGVGVVRVWTELLRECSGVVGEAYMSMARVWFDDLPDLGSSTTPAQTVVDSASSGVRETARSLEQLSTSMAEAANSFEELEEQIRSGFVSEMAAFDA